MLVRLRCLVVGVLLTVACSCAGLVLGRAAIEPGRGVADAMVRLCVVALLGCTAWAWLVGLAAVRDAWCGAGSAQPAAGGLVRRLVLAACGVAVTGALAGPAALALDPQDPLDGLPLPERAVGSGSTAQWRVPADRVTVRAGDTLWALAADRLADGAGDQAVDAAWRAVYRANRPVIGADPDLIVPGQSLRLPKEPT